jgi:hypothetical protein
MVSTTHAIILLVAPCIPSIRLRKFHKKLVIANCCFGTTQTKFTDMSRYVSNPSTLKTRDNVCTYRDVPLKAGSFPLAFCSSLGF